MAYFPCGGDPCSCRTSLPHKHSDRCLVLVPLGGIEGTRRCREKAGYVRTPHLCVPPRSHSTFTTSRRSRSVARALRAGTCDQQRGKIGRHKKRRWSIANLEVRGSWGASCSLRAMFLKLSSFDVNVRARSSRVSTPLRTVDTRMVPRVHEIAAKSEL